jgi:hypothetical protein
VLGQEPAAGQTAPPPIGPRAASLDSETAKLLQDATKTAIPLKSNTNVADNVSVESVLLPANVCQRLFGKEISDNYATIELIISNRSDGASLIVHSIFIDYSQWALSGFSQSPPISAEGSFRGGPAGNMQQPWQASNSPSQVASAEYRVPRGQMLDAQPWTARNVTIRILQTVGTIASAYTFTIAGKHAVESIGAYNGQVIPALETFWPDPSIGQMNRISDLGFQVNKVISKDSSDIIIAFFPIDRFLTPGLKKLFLKNPSMFFAPYEMLIDPKARQALKELISPLFQEGEKGKVNEAKLNTFLNDVSSDFRKQVPTDNTKFFDSLSLNNLRILVGGIMTVDVNSVPGQIVSVTMDGGNDNASVWTVAGDKTGVIKGSFLLTSGPTIVGPNPPDITDVAAVASGSTASELHFKMKLVNALNSGQKLTFKVVKKDSQNRDVESAPFEFTIPTFSAGKGETVPAKITSIDMDGGNDNAAVWTVAGDKTGVIKGTDLSGGTPTIVGADALGISTVTVVSVGSTATELHFTMKLGKEINQGQTLQFQVVKKDSQNKAVTSGVFNLVVPKFVVKAPGAGTPKQH